MKIIQFFYGGWEIFDGHRAITDFLWSMVFEDVPPLLLYSEEQCEKLMQFALENDINYKELLDEH
jgi:hypothetical protein